MSSSTGGKKRKTVKDEVHVYTGQGDVPDNVTHVKFHPSVVDIDNNTPFGGCNSLVQVTLNDGLREIGNHGFYCSKLQSITIPSTVTKIGHAAFMYCYSLREVVLNDGLLEIGGSAFSWCKSLQSIAIPSTVTEIGESAFYGCTGLNEVVLHNGLKMIGKEAFNECLSLESITIPSTVDDIGCWAFNKCINLREIVLNEGLTTIKMRAFEDCTSLQSITIPSTVIEIERYAFSGCTGLREVVIPNEKVQIGDKSVFSENCTSLERFKFPRLFSRLDNIIQAGQRDIEAKMDDIPAVEWRDGELIIPTVRRQVKNYWGREEIAIDFDREKVAKIVGLIMYYEVKEATTLFELALWKAKMNQVDISNPADREACRIEIPGPVKDTILQYLR